MKSGGEKADLGEVWVAAEQRLGRLMGVSLELLGKGVELAPRLGTKLAAVLMGERVEGLAGELLRHGADKVYLMEDPKLRFYQAEAYAELLARLIREQKPEVLLVGATALGRDLAPRVAAKIRTGLTAHCVDLYFDGEGVLTQVVPGWAGNLMLKIVCPQRRPQMVTIKPGVMTKPQRVEGRKGEVVRFEVDIAQPRAETLEMVEEEPQGIPLEAAEIVVAGGWGLQVAGGFGPVEELAGVLGGAVAGTRPAADKGWVPQDCLIGQSGKTVAPRLFISIGASGAMHFTTGFLKSKVILAIDRNPKAPIFEVADIGLVGDLRHLLPYLIEGLREMKSS